MPPCREECASVNNSSGQTFRPLALAFFQGDSRETGFCPAGRGVKSRKEFSSMGRGILLWLLGVPIPIIILLALFWH
jgi:hypothetical protein